MGYSELKVITIYNDAGQFEHDVNGWCCNCDYKIITCTVTYAANDLIYTAFLGK